MQIYFLIYYAIYIIHYTIYIEPRNIIITLLTKISAKQNEVALRYHSVHRILFMAFVFAATIVQRAFKKILYAIC